MNNEIIPPPPRNSPDSHLNYRPDIDGLRAFAVLVVIGFHFFPGWVKGGFVGVDIFFVISGFLIGGILLDALRTETFSLLEFYARRIRRIFPALILVMAFALALGWFALGAEDYALLGKHTAAGAGFISNLVLFTEAGYWDRSSHVKILLHLWSLGVEEQFYILLPLLLLFLWKKNLRLATCVTLCLVLSYALNLNAYHKGDASFDFYMPMTRFWELFVGVGLALWERRSHVLLPEAVSRQVHVLRSWGLSLFFRESERADAGNAFRSFLSMLGAVLLCVAVVKAKEKGFPGKQALIPVMGAALVIAADSRTWINRWIFSNRLAVGTGLISYPLYLWHWPILTYLRLITNDEIDTMRWARLGFIGLAFLLASVTYFLIEKPFRFGERHRRLKTGTLVVLLVLTGGMGGFVWYHQGYTQREAAQPLFIFGGGLSEAEREIVRNVEKEMGSSLSLSESDSRRKDYVAFEKRYGLPPQECLAFFNDAGGSHTTVVFGDSHANFAFAGIIEHNAKKGVNTILSVPHARPYLKDGSKRYTEGFRKCALRITGKDKTINKVFLITNSPLVLPQDQIDALKALKREGLKIYLVADNPHLSYGEWVGNDTFRKRVLRDLGGVHPFYAPFNKRNEIKTGEPLKTSFDLSRSEVEKHYQPYLEQLHAIKGVTVVEGALDAFCTQKICPVMDENGKPLYLDANHITWRTGGARLVDKVLRPYLDE